MSLKEAFLYKKLPDNKVACFLCAHRCLISEGKFGVCRVRQNKGGGLYTYAYGGVVAANIDPVEKKPLFHFLPGSKSFSIACAGCNFRCGFCQNWQISQKAEVDRLRIDQRQMTPGEVVRAALESGCRSISYTYTEPTIFFEYAYETAKIAKEKGLLNIFVTNGFMTKEALEMISWPEGRGAASHSRSRPYLGAANVDLKFFNDESYRRVCGGSLAPVLDTIILMRKLGIWVEVTTLIVPGENDSPEELKGIASFLAQAGQEIPWHISRFHPDYKMMDKDSTPVSILKAAYKIGKEAGLRYVYIGNVLEEEKTFCCKCAKPLIARMGFEVIENNLKNGACPSCGAVLDGFFA